MLDAHIKTFALQSIQQTQEAANVPKNVNYLSIKHKNRDPEFMCRVYRPVDRHQPQK